MKTSNHLYETGPLRDITGTTIRPGGLTLTDRALEFCSFAAGAQLLDVGCGAGASVEHLRSRYGLDASGVDISTALICEGLRRNPALPLSVGAAETLPYQDESRDGILCECVLSLLTEPRLALTEFRLLLRSGGYLILSDMYSKDTALGQPEAWLAENGFTILLWEDHTPLLRELAARLVMANGSLAGLCCTTAAKPGYYLLVARKE